jgi:hypothetical protein
MCYNNKDGDIIMETNIEVQELTKIADFISSINNLIHGKFILADVKINEVLNKVNESAELYHFIQEKLINFSFEKELRKSEIKNRFNGGVFKLPTGEREATALSFCLLVEFDAKRIDFYDFIKENFPTLDNKGDYKAFAEVVLMPLRDAVAKYFGLSKENNEEALKEMQAKIERETTLEVKEVEEVKDDKQVLFEDVLKIERHLLEIIKNDPKIKFRLKEDIVFVLKAMIYANKYEDLKILNALLVSFEHLTQKVKSIKFVYDELKQVILDYYSKK